MIQTLAHYWGDRGLEHSARHPEWAPFNICCGWNPIDKILRVRLTSIGVPVIAEDDPNQRPATWVPALVTLLYDEMRLQGRFDDPYRLLKARQDWLGYLKDGPVKAREHLTHLLLERAAKETVSRHHLLLPMDVLSDQDLKDLALAIKDEQTQRDLWMAARALHVGEAPPPLSSEVKDALIRLREQDLPVYELHYSIRSALLVRKYVSLVDGNQILHITEEGRRYLDP